MNRTACSFILLLCLAWIPAHGASIEEELDHLLKNQVLSLRYPFARGEMNFDSTGHALSNPQGPWLVFGAIYVAGVHLAPGSLRLEGQRVAVFDNLGKSKPTPVALGDAVKVNIHLEQPLSSVNEAQDLLNRVFFLGADNLQHAKPEYRRIDPPIEEPLYHVGPNKEDAKAPVPVYTPEPDYSETAGRRHVEGIVVLNVIVDKTGKVSWIRIVRPLGMGLDEKAVNAVKTWRFKPAMRKGEPVPVEMNIEVAFNLDSRR